MGEETGPARVVKDRLTFPCSCGALLPECGFWKSVSQEMATLGIDFGPTRWDLYFQLSPSRRMSFLLGRSLRTSWLDDLRDRCVSLVPPWKGRLQEIAARNAALIHVILRLTGKRVFAAASKDPIRARFLNRIPSLDIRVVHLTRDALGYVSSAIKNKGIGHEQAIRSWLRGARHAIRLRKHLGPEQFLHIRYEDICANVDREMATMARFVGLEPVAGPFRFRDVEHHIIGNRMRMQSSSEVILDEKWKERLSAEQIRLIESATKPIREHFGYA